MARYEAIESRRWFNRKTGATASIYGSTPYISAADKPNWSIKTVGYTVRDNQTGTIGTGRECPTQLGNQAWPDRE